MEQPRFDINPHVIRQLGAELVSDQTTALMELVKNSYDADADYVKIVIDTKNTLDSIGDLFYPSKKGYIIVEDNGFGMDADTILNSWLVISYSSKRAVEGVKPKTPKGRTPLGDKGLGRLSTQRLAQICEIYTKKDNSNALHVGFDWNDFDEAEKLANVSVRYDEKVFGFEKKHGTKLVLSGLMDEDYWSGSNLEQFKGLICKLISPYSELRPFDVFLSVNGEEIDVIQEMGKLNQLNVSRISFRYENRIMKFDLGVRMRKLIGNSYNDYSKFLLEDDGRQFLEFFFDDKEHSSQFEKADDEYWLKVHQEFGLEALVKTSLFEGEPADPGDFFGEIQEFYFSTNTGNSGWWNQLYSNFDEYKKFVQNQIGVRIYRNGFAIKPYGISEGNDWLNLGHAQTSASSFYGLRPGNVIGYVAIDESLNKQLKDKTDREGLIDNEYYRNFYKLVSEVVARMNQKISDLRRCYNVFKDNYTPKELTLKTLDDAFTKIKEVSEQGKKTAATYSDVKEKLKTVKDKADAIIQDKAGSIFEKADDSESMQVLEEVSKILAESNVVLEQANGVLHDSLYLEDALRLIQPKLETLEERLSNFSELASLGLISEMVSHDLGQIADRMLGKSSELERKLKNKQEITSNDIYSIVDFIKTTVASLKSQMKHLDSSMKYARDKKDTFSVAKMIEAEEIAYYKKKFEGTDMKIELIHDVDFEITMNSGKLIQVIDNLVNNSIYWLNAYRRRLNEEPRIFIRIVKPWIFVWDNGIGVDESVEEDLFDPFVTRKPQGEGRGLGLFIIRQLLDTIGCEVVLAPDRNEYGNRFRFSINMYNALKK